MKARVKLKQRGWKHEDEFWHSVNRRRGKVNKLVQFGYNVIIGVIICMTIALCAAIINDWCKAEEGKVKPTIERDYDSKSPKAIQV